MPHKVEQLGDSEQEIHTIEACLQEIMPHKVFVSMSWKIRMLANRDLKEMLTWYSTQLDLTPPGKDLNFPVSPQRYLLLGYLAEHFYKKGSGTLYLEQAAQYFSMAAAGLLKNIYDPDTLKIANQSCTFCVSKLLERRRENYVNIFLGSNEYEPRTAPHGLLLYHAQWLEQLLLKKDFRFDTSYRGYVLECYILLGWNNAIQTQLNLITKDKQIPVIRAINEDYNNEIISSFLALIDKQTQPVTVESKVGQPPRANACAAIKKCVEPTISSNASTSRPLSSFFPGRSNTAAPGRASSSPRFYQPARKTPLSIDYKSIVTFPSIGEISSPANKA